MSLWITWLKVVSRLRPAFSRSRSFLWFVTCLAGFSIRNDLLGVSSTVRALNLDPGYYDRLLDSFHSSSVKPDDLARHWSHLLTSINLPLVTVNNRIIIVGDGIKNPKTGRKMPAVKYLHQESSSNTKPSFIMGHSCQALALLAGDILNPVAMPLTSRIHEGVVFSNRDSRSLLDRFILMLDSLDIQQPFYLVADAYYAARSIIGPLASRNQHLVTRVRRNATAYEPVERSAKPGRGRPRKYGRKVYLSEMFKDRKGMVEAKSPVYGEKTVKIRYRSRDLLWRPAGMTVRFVAVEHPTRGRIILMTTDLSLEPVEALRIYSMRIKIEVMFKEGIRVVGAYGYHFWMGKMEPIKRGSGNQYLHMKTDRYREGVRRKIEAYHRYLQTGLIAQGLLQYLAIAETEEVWKSFGSWLRTKRPEVLPTAFVTAEALRNTYPELLAVSPEEEIFVKFLQEIVTHGKCEAFPLVA